MDVRQSCFLFSLLLIGCGGGSESTTPTSNPATSTNSAPISNAGEDQAVAEGVTVNLDGSGSSDSDGSISAYDWSQVSGIDVDLSDSTTQNVSFITPVYTENYAIVLRLTVTDNDGATSSDDVTIDVSHQNSPPMIDLITSNQGTVTDYSVLVNEQLNVSLKAMTNDLDGSIQSYSWTQVSGQDVIIEGQETDEITLVTPSVIETEVLQFTFTVTDNLDAVSHQTINLNVVPVFKGMAVDDPLNNAQIHLLDPDSRELIATTTTDAEGFFEIGVSDTRKGFIVRTQGGSIQGTNFEGEMLSVCPVSDRGNCHITPLTTLVSTYSDKVGLLIEQKEQAEHALGVLLNIDLSNDPFISEATDGSVNVSAIRNKLGNDGAGLDDWVEDVINYVDGREVPQISNFFAGADDALRISAGEDLLVEEQQTVNLTASVSGDNGTFLTYQWTQISGTHVVLQQANTSQAFFVAPDIEADETLVFRLGVSADNSAEAFDSISISVSAINQKPVVNAGANQSVVSADTVKLIGSAEDTDGTIVSSSWRQIEGPVVEFTSSSNFEASFVAPDVGSRTSLIFEFNAIDNGGEESSANVTVVISPIDGNQLPKVNAGEDAFINEQVTYTLSGEATDEDGEITSISWQQTKGSAVVINNADTLTAQFVAPTVVIEEVLNFTLSAVDNEGEVNSDSVSLTVIPLNVAPVVDAGPDQSVLSARAVTLSATASDDDGSIQTYSWTQLSGPQIISLLSSDAAISSFESPVVSQSEVYTFQVTAWDNEGAFSSDQVSVTVNPNINNAPQVDAGSDEAVEEQITVQLSGTASDSDGFIASYQWSQQGGSQSVTINDSNRALASFFAPDIITDEIYRFRLTVTDDDGATSSDTVNIEISAKPNVLPTVDAGEDISVIEGETVNLNGTAIDTDGTIRQKFWGQLTGNQEITLTGAETDNASFTAPEVISEEDYIFRFVAWDNQGEQANDTVTVTVNPAANIPPTLELGGDRNLNESMTHSITASPQDSDGTIVSYLWEHDIPSHILLQGTDTATVSFTAPDVDGESTDISNGMVAQMILKLTVTDNDGATAIDKIYVLIVDPDIVPPVANAGPDITVNENSEVTIVGTGTDADGFIGLYVWGLLSLSNSSAGPVAMKTNNGTLTFTAPEVSKPETIRFRFSVSDNDSAWDDDEVTVTVLPVP